MKSVGGHVQALEGIFPTKLFTKALFPLSFLNLVFSFHCLEMVYKNPKLLVLPDAVLQQVNWVMWTHGSASDEAVTLMTSTAALCSLHPSRLAGVGEEEEVACHRWVSAKEETGRKMVGFLHNMIHFLRVPTPTPPGVFLLGAVCLFPLSL